MPATILSDNGASSGTAGLKTSGSNDGILELQTTTAGGTATAAITIDTAQRSKFPTTIGVGGATPATSGSGITFPATASASSDANTLDDYEEGTFSPAVYGTSSAGTGTYSVQIGRYVKIGNRVWVDILLVWSAHTGTGNIGVNALPFTVLNLSEYYPPINFYSVNLALTAGNTAFGVFLTNTTTIELSQQATGGGAQNGISIDTAATLRLQGNYIVN